MISDRKDWSAAVVLGIVSGIVGHIAPTADTFFFMSKNLSALSFRKELDDNIFARMVDAAATTGSAENQETVRGLAGTSSRGGGHFLGSGLLL
ncbi:MAG: hypothetical protein R3F31_27425 [Verrucomicrobiales bacterium]